MLATKTRRKSKLAKYDQTKVKMRCCQCKTVSEGSFGGAHRERHTIVHLRMCEECCCETVHTIEWPKESAQIKSAGLC